MLLSANQEGILPEGASNSVQLLSGTVAVTGGLGSLGSLLALWIGGNGNIASPTCRLVLLGRSARSPEVFQRLTVGAASELQFSLRQCDASAAEDSHSFFQGHSPVRCR